MAAPRRQQIWNLSFACDKQFLISQIVQVNALSIAARNYIGIKLTLVRTNEYFQALYSRLKVSLDIFYSSIKLLVVVCGVILAYRAMYVTIVYVRIEAIWNLALELETLAR